MNYEQFKEYCSRRNLTIIEIGETIHANIGDIYFIFDRDRVDQNPIELPDNPMQATRDQVELLFRVCSRASRMKLKQYAVDSNPEPGTAPQIDANR